MLIFVYDLCYGIYWYNLASCIYQQRTLIKGISIEAICMHTRSIRMW